MIVLVVIVVFPLFGPLGKKAAINLLLCRYFLSTDPFVSPLLFFFYIKAIDNHQNIYFVTCLPPWQETFGDARDGDGGGGPFGTI